MTLQDLQYVKTDRTFSGLVQFLIISLKITKLQPLMEVHVASDPDPEGDKSLTP